MNDAQQAGNQGQDRDVKTVVILDRLEDMQRIHVPEEERYSQVKMQFEKGQIAELEKRHADKLIKQGHAREATQQDMANATKRTRRTGHVLPQALILVVAAVVGFGFGSVMLQAQQSSNGPAVIDSNAKQMVYDDPAAARVIEYSQRQKLIGLLQGVRSGQLDSQSQRDALLHAVGVKTADEAGQAQIDVNSATIEQLQTLDGVGDTTAQAIVDGRPYEKHKDLLKVRGVGVLTILDNYELIGFGR